jgi:prevent-host-death family protein
MVMNATLVTMSAHGWSIAEAKAELSRLVREAQAAPQVIENRGEAVAVVLSLEEYQALKAATLRADRWRAALAVSAAVRDDGGADLEIAPRAARPSPFLEKNR